MAEAKVLLADAEDRMHKAVEALRRELATIRTGRANPALVDHVRVDYYGTPTPIGQMATIAVPDPRQLVIQPWDRQTLGAIERALMKSDLGIMPTNDGTMIRLTIPQLTEERRRDLARQVKRKVEEGKVALRNVRRDVVEHFRAMEKQKEIAEDEHHRLGEQLQRVTDHYIGEMEKVGQAKEAELLEV